MTRNVSIFDSLKATLKWLLIFATAFAVTVGAAKILSTIPAWVVTALILSWVFMAIWAIVHCEMEVRHILEKYNKE